MKPLVIYHANCADGFGAAFAAWLKLGDDAEYIAANYGEATGASYVGRDVYILDFSFPRLTMEQMFADAKRVVWLDHHKSAFEMWCGKAPNEDFQSFFDPHDDAPVEHYILLDNNKSGALLAWEYFHPRTEVPLLIQHIDDRDRWQFKLEGSKELHAALSSYKPWSFEQWLQYVPFFDDTRPYIDLKPEGAAILRAQDAHVQSMVKHARKCEIWKLTSGAEIEDLFRLPGLAVNATLHQSEVGHELANQSGTYGLVWRFTQEGTVACSLRSNGDYDVSAIARAFGGGGHLNAAGFETDITTLMGWMK